jgi:PTS system mannose-specific IIA component
LLGRPGSEEHRSLAPGRSNYRNWNEVIVFEPEKDGTAGTGSRIDVFDRHEFAEKPRERYVLMPRKSALSGARRADVTGFGVRTGTKFPNEQVRSMIGIVLVAHGRLAAEFRAALEHVAGPQKQIESIAIDPDDDIEQRRQDIVSAVIKVDSGAGVVVLTDMFGGTPSNLAISIMNGSNIEVIAAVNLPMLIKLASVRENSSLKQAVIQARDAGRKYIYLASEALDTTPDRVDMPFDQAAIRDGGHSEGSVVVSVGG